MKLVSDILIILVILLHALFFYLEIFLWTKPSGLKIFQRTKDHAQDSASLAANQGLYNGFLTAGLLWALLHPNSEISLQLKIFFLVCVVIAGIFGAATVNKKIFWIQALPAILALLSLLL